MLVCKGERKIEVEREVQDRSHSEEQPGPVSSILDNTSVCEEYQCGGQQDDRQGLECVCTDRPDETDQVDDSESDADVEISAVLTCVEHSKSDETEYDESEVASGLVCEVRGKEYEESANH